MAVPLLESTTTSNPDRTVLFNAPSCVARRAPQKTTAPTMSLLARPHRTCVALEGALQGEIGHQQTLVPILQTLENFSIWVHYCRKAGKVLIER